jgi:Domain of unknown function (DUF2019)
MSAEDYAAMTTKQLIQVFVETAAATPNVFARLGQPGLIDKIGPTPERQARVLTIKRISAALRARKPIAQIRRLFEDGNPDVRGWAGAQFLPIDPEWASAAVQGLLKGHSTREVLELLRRVMAPPPPAPTLKEMSDDALVARFEDAATREYATRLLDDDEEDKQRATDLRNDILGEVWDVMRELKARGLLERLLPLLESPNVTVQREAAVACLRIAEDKAVPVLEQIGAHAGWDDKYAALGALDNWRRNGMVVYGV